MEQKWELLSSTNEDREKIWGKKQNLCGRRLVPIP